MKIGQNIVKQLAGGIKVASATISSKRVQGLKTAGSNFKFCEAAWSYTELEIKDKVIVK